MKKNFFILALLGILLGFTSCIREPELNVPNLYVVNGSDYSVQVLCDNHLVATAGAHNNSGTITLDNVSINLPVYVEMYYYDKKGNYVGKGSWDNYYFRWNKTYKITVTNSGSTIIQI